MGEREEVGRMIWCAEIGSMHRGSKELAHRMIYEASKAGATIAKFQLGWPKPNAENRVERTRQIVRHAPMKWVDELDGWCKEYGIEFMASIWSQEGLDAARSVNMKRYKIAHQKIVDIELMESMTKFDHEVFASTTTSSRWVPKARTIYTTDEYPTLRSNVSLPGFGDFWYGYSDHTVGIEVPLQAVARGAKYIEVHLTLDPTNMEIRDNAFASTPQQFKEMVDIGERISPRT